MWEHLPAITAAIAAIAALIVSLRGQSKVDSL